MAKVKITYQRSLLVQVTCVLLVADLEMKT